LGLKTSQKDTQEISRKTLGLTEHRLCDTVPLMLKGTLDDPDTKLSTIVYGWVIDINNPGSRSKIIRLGRLECGVKLHRRIKELENELERLTRVVEAARRRP
jgi:hypothetical protein